MSDRGKKEAFVTLATNDTYSLGCLVLGSSLRRVGTTRQLVVMVTTGVTNSMRTQLAQVYDLIQEVNVLDSQDPINLSLLGRPDLNVTFTKLHCWRLTQFEKAVFLDADTLVLQNVDELFDREELSASPDAGWPDCFNSGVFVFKPSQDTYESLLNFATSRGSFDGGDQGLLNLYFSDWATKDISKHLPFIYNVVSQAFYSYLPAFTQFKDRVKIVHFIGAVKPWHHTYNTSTNTVTPLPGTGHSQEFLQVWWNIFMEMVQPNLDPSLQEAFLRNVFFDKKEPENTNTNSEQNTDRPAGTSTSLKVVYPYKNPDVAEVFYKTKEDNKMNIVEMEVIPRSYSELENYYAEEPLSHINPEEPGKSIYDVIWITEGWEKSRKVLEKESEKSRHSVEKESDKGHSVEHKVEENHKDSVESVKPPSPEPISINEEASATTNSIKHEEVIETKPETVSIKPEGSTNSEVQESSSPPSVETEVGLVSQLSGLSIQGPGMVSPTLLSDQERKLNWEKGCIDYLGQDSFENIQRKIESSMTPTEPQPEPPAPEPPAPEKSAPKTAPAPAKPAVATTTAKPAVATATAKPAVAPPPAKPALAKPGTTTVKPALSKPAPATAPKPAVAPGATAAKPDPKTQPAKPTSTAMKISLSSTKKK